MRAIDADELIKTIEKICFSPEWARFRADFGSNGERDYIINEIVNAPTIEERPTGEWEKSNFTYEIDALALGEGVRLQVYTCSNPYCCMSVTRRTAYCPNCGAKMKGEEE